MHAATLLLIVLAAGLASQWLAWRIALPGIVVLIAAGLVLGPGTGIIELTMPQPELTELIGLGVALILFEGGMDLKLGEFRRVGHGIGRLTVVGPPVAWLAGSLAGAAWGGLVAPLVATVIGAVALGVICLFQLVTLPVEFDATRRAKTQLVQLGIVDRDEMPGVNETLDAAALTYVAALASSLGYLLHIVMMLLGGRSEE